MNLTIPVWKIGWVPNNLFGLDNFAFRRDVNDAVFYRNRFYGFVQHISASINGRQSCKTLITNNWSIFGSSNILAAKVIILPAEVRQGHKEDKGTVIYHISTKMRHTVLLCLWLDHRVGSNTHLFGIMPLHVQQNPTKPVDIDT